MRTDALQPRQPPEPAGVPFQKWLIERLAGLAGAPG